MRRPDGHVTARIYQDPAFHETPAGDWKPIDARLRAQSDPEAPVAAPDALHPLQFGATPDTLMELDVDGGSIRLQSRTISVPRPSLDGDASVVYRGVAPQTDLRFNSFTGGVQGELWLHGPAAPRSFTFHLSDPADRLGGLTRREDGSYISEKPIDDENHLVLERAVAYTPATSETELGSGHQPGSAHMTVEKAGDGWDITKWVDPGWMADKDFPIVLDPMWSYSTANGIAEDCYIAGPNRYDGAAYCNASLQVGSPSYGTSLAYRTRTLLRFDDINTVPSTAHIHSARIGLHQYGEKTAGDLTYDVYEVKEWWANASWSDRVLGTPWSYGGGGGWLSSDVKASATGLAATLSYPLYENYTWFTGSGLVPMLRRWRGLSVYDRYGVAVRVRNEAYDSNRSFWSSRNAIVTGTPVLEVTYSEPPTAVTVIPSDGSLKVAWQPPADVPGDLPTKHVVSIWTAGISGVQVATADIPCPLLPSGVTASQCPRSAIFDGLVNGTEYVAKVATHFAAGATGTGQSPPATPSAVAAMTGREAWWSYDEHTPEPAGTVGVNMGSGNAVVQHVDSTPLQGHGRMGYVLRRTYNSHAAADDTLPGSLGAGWMLNVSEVDGSFGDVVATALDVPANLPFTDPAAPVYLTDRDGTRHRFTPRMGQQPKQLLKTTLGGAPFADASAGLGTLLPKRLRPGADEIRGTYNSVCIDRTYEAPPGVELGLWRYIAVNNGGSTAAPCTATTGTVPVLLGYATMRPDRVRSEFSFDGRLLSQVDGTGTELRYLYQLGVPRTGVALGNLEAVFEPRSCSAAGAGMSGAEVLLASQLGTGCRAFRFTYAGRVLSSVIDPAGRTTQYTSVPSATVLQPRLTRVTHDDGSWLGYHYRGINDTSTGCPTGALCMIRDARSSETRLRYATYSVLPGVQGVSSLTDRRGNVTNYSRGTGFAKATAQARVREFSGIDNRGRVRYVKDADTGNVQYRFTETVWDTDTSRCRAPDNEFDNNLCSVTQHQVGTDGAPSRTTSFTYNPDGMVLTERSNGSSGFETTTHGHVSQYVGTDNQARLWYDRVDGGSVVASDGPSRVDPAGRPAVYTLVDRTATLGARGNSEPPAGAGSSCESRDACRAYLVRYVVDNVHTTSTNTVVPGGFCGTDAVPGTRAANSGLVCEVTDRAYNNRTDAAALHSRTLFRYDQFGQRESMVTPEAVRRSDLTKRYRYTYYGDSQRELTGNVSAGGWLLGVTDPDSKFVAFGYDRAGNAIRTWDRGATARAGQPLSAYPGTLASPPSTQYTQQLFGPGDPAGNATSRPWRYVRSHRDALGNVTTRCVDANGNPTVSRSARGTEGSFAAPCPASSLPGKYDTLYDTVGETGVPNTPAGAQTLVHRAAPDDRTVSVVRPTNHGTSAHIASRVQYSVFGEPVHVYDELGNLRVDGYDNAGRYFRSQWTRGPAGPDTTGDCTPGTTTTAGLFPAGRVLCETRVSYDGLDNVMSEHDAAGTRIDHTYDGAGRRIVTTVPRSATVGLRHQWAYDSEGNVVRYCPPRQLATVDEAGEESAPQTAGCPAGGLFSEHLSYDPAGRQVSRTRYRQQPGAGTGRTAASESLLETTTYDADGNPVTRRDARANALVVGRYDTRLEYDLQSRLITQRVPFAATPGSDYVTSYLYDPAGTLRAEIKPAPVGEPRITAYTYDALNRLRDRVEGADSTDGSTGLPDAQGGRNRRTRHLYDRDGNLVGVYDPRAFTSSVTSPNVAYLARIDVDEDGRPTSYFVPRFSSSVPEAVEYLSECATEASAEYAPEPVTVPSSMDPVPNYGETVAVCRTRLEYDARDQLVAYLPASADETYEIVDGPGSHRVKYRYTDDGLLAELDEPGANATSTAPGRDVTTFRYDGAGRKRSMRETVSARTRQWSYALDGTLTATSLPTSTDGRTHVWTYGYNLAGDMIRTVNPEEEAATATHYSDGLLAEHTDGAGNTLRYHYDRNGNPMRTYSPAAVWSLANPDPGSRDKTNESGTATLNYYDVANQLVTTLVPVRQDGTEVRRTDYTYDPGGRRADTTTYHATCPLTAGRCEPTDRTDVVPIPGRTSGTQSLTYYRNDLVAQRIGRPGPTGARPVIGYTYDAAGAMTKVTDSTNPGADVEVNYYLDGLVRQVSDGTRPDDYRTDYDYTGDGLVSDRRHSLRGTTSSDFTSYTYNARRLLTHWIDPGAAAASIVYDEDARPVTIDGTYSTATLVHDNDDTLVSKTIRSPQDNGSLLARWTYAYDEAQRITEQRLDGRSMAEPDESPPGSAPGQHGVLDNRAYRYEYDDAGRLVEFDRAVLAADGSTLSSDPVTIEHDRNGNRRRYGTTTAEFNPDDTIRMNGSGTHRYLPFGGHEADDCTANRYDGFDRLVAVTVTAGETCGAQITGEYAYDGLDRQRHEAGSVSDGVETWNVAAGLHYDGLGSSLAIEARSITDWTRYMLDPTGNTLGTRTSAPPAGETDVETLVDDGTGNHGLSVEHVHTPSGTGALVYGCTMRFDPYGDPVGRSEDGRNNCNTGRTASSRLYRGARRDPATGSYQFGSRTYVPGRAGFLTPDTFATAGTPRNLGLSVDPLTRNSYAYVNGDPINLYDPTGHGLRSWAKKAVDVVVGAVQQVGGVVRGIGEAVYEVGEGVVQLAWTGVAMVGLRGQEAFDRTWAHATATYEAIKADPWTAGKAVVGAFAEGIRNDWSRGNYGEAIGHGLFEAFASLVGGGVAAQMAGKLGDLSAIGRAAENLADIGTAVRGSGKALFRADGGGPSSVGTSRHADAGSTCDLNSFVSETPVLMGDGSTKPIERVEIGDEVLATDPKSGITEARPVTDLIVGNGNKNLVDLTIGGGVVTATDGHPFWTADDRRWTDADDIQPGDQLRTQDGALVAVTSTNRRTRSQRVHNLTVAHLHTYYVLAGDTPVLVHNCKIVDPRVENDLAKGRFDYSHYTEDIARRAAQTRVGDLGDDALKMYDPETGTLIGMQSRSGLRGWRNDGDHYNYWDWSGGKKGRGGVYGHDFYPTDLTIPHSKYPGYARWVD